MLRSIHEIWSSEDGQNLAEYAVMFALILVLVIGTVRLAGEHTKNVFSRVAGVIQQQPDGD